MIPIDELKKWQTAGVYSRLSWQVVTALTKTSLRQIAAAAIILSTPVERRAETSGQINIPCSTGYRLHPMQPRFRYVTRYQSCPRNRNSTLSPIRALPKRHFIQEIDMDYRQAYGGAKPKRLPRSRLSVPYPPLRPVCSMLHAIVTIFSIRLAQFVSIVRRTISKDLFSGVRWLDTVNWVF